MSSGTHVFLAPCFWRADGQWFQANRTRRQRHPGGNHCAYRGRPLEVHAPHDEDNVSRHLCRYAIPCRPQNLDTILSGEIGGDLAFFKVERAEGTAMPYVDVLACGNGQWGGLGNNQFSNGQGTPVRTKNVSGLMECTSNPFWS